MDDRAAQFRVGVLVVATLFIAGLLIMLFGKPGFSARRYTIFVRFPEAPGVTVDTPVTKSGILIGRVSSVTLLDNDDGAVVVTLRVDSQRKLRSNEVCRISSGSILGDAVLEFVPSGQSRGVNAVQYRDGDYMDGIVAQDPLSVMETATSALEVLVNLENDVREALDSVNGAGQQVGAAAEGLNAVVGNNAQQLQRILTKTESAMDRFDFAMTAIDRFIRDDNLKNQIDEIISQVPDLMTDAGDVMATLKESIEGFRGTMEDFKGLGETVGGIGESVAEVLDRANTNLENLEGLTGPLGQRGEALSKQLDDSMVKIDQILGNLVTFSDGLNNKESTLGKLMYDRELYDRVIDATDTFDQIAGEVKGLTRDARDVTRELRPAVKQLQPILKNVNVFTDKVSRDPGRIGVKGLLDRNQSGVKW